MSMKINCDSWKEVIDTLKRTELTNDSMCLIISPVEVNNKLKFEIETEN